MTVFLVSPFHGDAETLASQYAVIARVVTDVTDSADPASAGQRLSEYLVVFGSFVPKLVLEHELGHARACVQAGGHPRVRLLKPWQGRCEYDDLPRNANDLDLKLGAAGVNQCTVDADLQYAVWARSGGVGYPEALDYLLSQTNLMLYSGRTSICGPSRYDDISGYVQELTERDHPISVGRVFLLSALADLASGPVWAAIQGQAQFLSTGARTVPMPTLRLGNLTATYPNFQVFLTPKGLVIGGTTFIGDDPRRATQVSVYRSDFDATWAVGLRWHNLSAGEHITLSPCLRATLGDCSGWAAGVDVREATQRRVSLMGRLEYIDDDLLEDPLGKEREWAAYVGLVLQLP